MDNTTPDAILADFEATIVGLTPSGGAVVGGKTAYALIDQVTYNEEPEDTAKSELDRQIQIHPIVEQEISLQGMSTSSVFTGQFDMVIGHMRGNYRDSRDRMMKDRQQIIAQMIHLDNKPDGVQNTWFKASGYEMIREGTYFWSTLRFGIEYATDADYGGN